MDIGVLLLDNLGTLTSILLGIAAVGAVLVKSRKVLQEVLDVLQALLDVTEDNKITKEEVDYVIKEAKDVIAFFTKTDKNDSV